MDKTTSTFLSSLRSSPSRRMDVRMTGQRFGPYSPRHKSFKLTRPARLNLSAKKGLLKSAFGNFVPGTFKKIVQSEPQSHGRSSAEQKQDYFLRQTHSDRSLDTKEEQERYAEGLLYLGHAKGAKMGEGYNPKGHEHEEAQRLLKKYAEKTAPPPERRRFNQEARNPLLDVRARLGIQHSAFADQPSSQSSWQAPTHLGGEQPKSNEPATGQGWTNKPDAPSTDHKSSTPAFGAPATGLTGGYITTPRQPSRPLGTAIAPTQPPTRPESSEKPAPPPPSPDTELPDPGQVRELPI